MASPMKFAAYYKQTINVIDELYNHMSPAIKKLVVICYKQIVEATVKIVSQGKLPPVVFGAFTKMPVNTE
jgi:hypothetical protein